MEIKPKDSSTNPSLISDWSARRARYPATDSPKAALRFSQTDILSLFLLVGALLPTLLVRIPALEDYPNHLARMYILAMAGSADANPYYQVSWALYPDLAMDLIVPTLGRVMDIEFAGWIFFLVAQLLVVTGAIAIELAIKRRHELAAVAAVLTLYSLPFSLGLVNFEFGTGIALWGIASWIALCRTSDWRMQNAVNAPFVVVIFLSHFFALGMYGLIIGLLELRNVYHHRLRARQAVLTFTILAWPVILMLGFMKVSGGAVGELNNEWLLTWKPIWLALFLNGYSVPLAAGSAAALAVLMCYCGLKRSLSISSEGKWICVGLAFCFLALPFKLFGSQMADIRLITAAFLILPAFVTFVPERKSLRHLLAVGSVTIIAINVTYIAHIWLSYRSDYTAMKASFALLRQGSFVLVASSAIDSPSSLLIDAPIARAPTLAVYYAKAFVSSLYTVPGTHAVEIRPNWKHLDVNDASESYAPPSVETLETIAHGGDAPLAPRYIRNWTRDFDYVYLLGPPSKNILPDALDELTAERRFTLYRVRK